MITRKRVTWVLRFLVSAGLLGWILTRPELRTIWNEGYHLDFVWLFGGLLCAGLSLILCAWRWQSCLHALNIDIPLGNLLKISLAATAAGYVSFGALGTDLAKIVLIGRQFPGRHGGVFSSIILDHVSALPSLVAMVLMAGLAHGVGAGHNNHCGIGGRDSFSNPIQVATIQFHADRWESGHLARINDCRV